MKHYPFHTLNFKQSVGAEICIQANQAIEDFDFASVPTHTDECLAFWPVLRVLLIFFFLFFGWWFYFLFNIWQVLGFIFWNQNT